MIKSKVYGVYDLSVDGGVTFTNQSKNLILNTYYAKTSLTENMTLLIGSGSTPPELTDTSLEAQFGTSATEAGFEPSPERVVFSDRFEIKYSRIFDFGVGFTDTLRELGVNNNGLISRALLKAADQNPTSVTLVNTDHVIIRYSLIYVVSRVPVVFNLTVNTVPVVATITAVNGEFGGWGTTTPAEVVVYDNFGVDVAGTWTIDSNGNIVGPNISDAVSVITNVNGISNLTIVGTIAAGISDWNQTFQQILVTSSGNNFITAPILIDLDVPITKTSDDVITMSISANQAA